MCGGSKGETDRAKRFRKKKNAQKEDMGERSHLFLKGLFESVVPKHLIRENSLVLEFIPHAALSPRPPA